MASTTSFNWETPDDTDLVKDGAAAIRTLGNSIDTSMTDLLGGTTGQVLAKASNTNMDFTWVAQDDSNAIQNAIVDAKGDLIAATAADTPARLAVGTNDHVLTADSTAATGLKWALPDANKTWTSYTPTVSAGSGTITSSTALGAYLRVGATVFYIVEIAITNAGTGAGFLAASLPITPTGLNSGVSQERQVTSVAGSAQVNAGNATVYMLKYDGTTFIANSRTIVGTGFYTV